MGSLEGKVAWVTGAGSGIGLAGAEALAAAGATVVMSGRREEVLAAEAARLRGAGRRVEIDALDVTNADDVARVADGIRTRHGRIDILVNSAGLNIPARFWKNLSVPGWNEVIRVNLDGSYYCCAAVLPSMRERHDGVIINISSWAGRFDSYMTGPAYNAAKHAVVAMTAHLNQEECINGIRATALCPAEVATPIMNKRPVKPSDEDIARMLQPEDLGNAILWIAQQPAHVCINELLISPTWNRIFLGADDLKRR
jgi:NADP-dependent 3-hydroxy acid dehydrogenase YdfG